MRSNWLFIFSHFCQLLLILLLTIISPPLNAVSKVALNYFGVHITAKKLLHKYTRRVKNVTFFIVFSQQANGGPTAHYTSAARKSHCNKLLFINSLFLVIFNNLYILHRKVQILAFQQESAYLYTGE